MVKEQEIPEIQVSSIMQFEDVTNRYLKPENTL